MPRLGLTTVIIMVGVVIFITAFQITVVRPGDAVPIFRRMRKQAELVQQSVLFLLPDDGN